MTSFVLNRLPEYLLATPGYITIDKQLLCYTLEDRWADNQVAVSCIPQGVYRLAWTFSQRFQRQTIQVLNVPGRTGIRFHAGNTIVHTTGCVLTASDLIIQPNRLWAEKSDYALQQMVRVFFAGGVDELIVI